MVDESRFFPNNFPNYDETSTLLGPDNKLIGKVSEDIKEFISCRLQQIHHVYKDAISKRFFDKSHECCVYTGTAGIFLLYQNLVKSGNSNWNNYLAFADQLLTKAHPSKQSITFLCGDAGPFALGAVHCFNKGDKDGMKKYIADLLGIYQWSSSKKLDNELLYGRAGYLYALLFVKQQISMEVVPDTLLRQLIDDLIDDGLKAVNTNSQLALHYIWYGEEYVGAAHGYIGIFYMLLQVKELCPSILNKKNEELLISSIDNLLSQRFPSGNMKPSTGPETDKLIHWCHGASGAVHLYALAYKIFKKKSYLLAAESFADNVWTRGLLRRGYGICHGVSGNGYTHLCMYQLTNDKKYLWRAIKFAEWCLLYGQHDCRVPDTPYSLFEGLAGTLSFLHDMLFPEIAKFPAFQLVSYK